MIPPLKITIFSPILFILLLFCSRYNKNLDEYELKFKFRTTQESGLQSRTKINKIDFDFLVRTSAKFYSKKSVIYLPQKNFLYLRYVIFKPECKF